MAVITRENLSGLIPEPVTREIIQGAVAQSTILRMARRLPNMTSKTQTLNVLDALPMAYFVNGEATESDSTTSLKKTTSMEWSKKKIYAEEIAVIVPISESVLDDANYDIWGEVRPRLVEQFGKVIDKAILYGTDKPASWRAGLVPSATTAGAVVAATPDIYADIMGENGVIAKVEESGYLPNGVVGAIQLRSKLRGLTDANGQPIFKADMQGATNYALDGMDMYFPTNGAFDPSASLAIVGDWTQLVYAIRQDITFKIFDSGVIQDPSSGDIKYNLIQNDMVALRAVMRLGWEIPNPINAYNANLDNAFPFAVYAAATGTISTVDVTPATPTVAKGSGQQFAASVSGTGGPYSTAVTWSVSGASAVAAGTQISQSGYLTVDAAETNTTLTVTAKSRQTPSVTDTATVTVSGG